MHVTSSASFSCSNFLGSQGSTAFDFNLTYSKTALHLSFFFLLFFFKARSCFSPPPPPRPPPQLLGWAAFFPLLVTGNLLQRLKLLVTWVCSSGLRSPPWLLSP